LRIFIPFGVKKCCSPEILFRENKMEIPARNPGKGLPGYTGLMYFVPGIRIPGYEKRIITAFGVLNVRRTPATG